MITLSALFDKALKARHKTNGTREKASRVPISLQLSEEANEY